MRRADLIRRVGLLALAAGALATGAHAAENGDRVEGHRLASAWCSDCHAIGREAPESVNDMVPSFRHVAALPSTTALSIRVFLLTSHRVMPNFNLTAAQIDDLAAYILSLRSARP